MNLETAHNLVWAACAADDLRIAVQALTDWDLSGLDTEFMTCLIGIQAGTFRDLELALDLTGNRDAPL